MLYTALIAFIWYEGDEEEKNLNTLLDLLNESETREEDETYPVSYTHLKKSWKKMNVTDVPMENVDHVSVSVTNQ